MFDLIPAARHINSTTSIPAPTNIENIYKLVHKWI